MFSFALKRKRRRRRRRRFLISFVIHYFSLDCVYSKSTGGREK
jgi:hypothetical protein